MLKVDSLSTWYWTRRGPVRAVNQVSFVVKERQTVGIVGETGSGKSTVVRSLTRLIRPPGRIMEGRVELGGVSLLELKERELRKVRGAQVGFVGQSPFGALHPILTVETQFRNVLNAHRRIPKAEAYSIARGLLHDVGIPGPERVLSSYCHELSGGMAQRVVIAIAMVMKPVLLIADEPTTALDLTVQRQILDLLRSLTTRGDTSVLLVTHDLSVVAQYCDWVVVMYAGKVVEQGPVDRVFVQPMHPYTRALLDAVPQAGRRLVGLMGSPVDLIDYPTGCPYRATCPLAFERCAVEAPAPHLEDGDRQVSCHLSPDQVGP
jgi:peptide/nickel transport system ATP-binding protein